MAGWSVLLVALVIGGRARRSWWLLVALVVHTALGLLPDPAPSYLHRGVGTLVLTVCAGLSAQRLWSRLAALLVGALALATQTPLRALNAFVPSAAALRSFAARGGTACDLAGIHEELLRRGEPGIDLALAKQQLGPDLTSVSTSPLSIEVALRLDLFAGAELRTLSASPEFVRLFDPRLTRLALVLPENATWVRVLTQTQALKDLARKNLSAAILDAMPDRPRAGALEAFASGCRLLDLLPGAADAGELRARAHRLLLACQVRASFLARATGGFSDAIDAPGKPPHFATLATTRQACELMRRFGVPEGIDKEALRAVLLARLSAESRFFRTPGSLGADAALALCHLHAAGPIGRDWLLGERDLLGVLLVVLVSALLARSAVGEPQDRSPVGDHDALAG